MAKPAMPPLTLTNGFPLRPSVAKAGRVQKPSCSDANALFLLITTQKTFNTHACLLTRILARTRPHTHAHRVAQIQKLASEAHGCVPEIELLQAAKRCIVSVE